MKETSTALAACDRLLEGCAAKGRQEEARRVPQVTLMSPWVGAGWDGQVAKAGTQGIGYGGRVKKNHRSTV